MQRTTIMLDEELKLQIEQGARNEGVSLAQWMQRAARQRLAAMASESKPDPLFSDTATFDGEVPEDLADNHDQYLYG